MARLAKQVGIENTMAMPTFVTVSLRRETYRKLLEAQAILRGPR